MKKIVLLIVVIAWTASVGYTQTLRVANNNPGAATGVNVYTGATALQDAITAAVAGDIIYVVPSLVSYGNIDIDKGITIFGIGIRPAKDLGTKSTVGTINILASNVRISGLRSNTVIYLGNGISATLTGITIENCVFRNLQQTNGTSLQVDQVLLRNNIITNNGWGGIAFYTSSNVTITNNVIYCTRTTGAIIGSILFISNNLFVGDQRAVETAVDCVFDHNIFHGASLTIGSGSTGNVWDSNMSFGSANDVFPVGTFANTSNSANFESVDPLFVNFPINTTWLDSYDISLQATSPALTVNNGTTTDIGPSGGTTPFNAEGNLLPLVQAVTIPATITVGSDLPVTIKAKGN